MHTIDLNLLKAVVARLLDEAIAEQGSDQFELADNFYWRITFPEQFDVSAHPAIKEVGSLHDDWEMTNDLADVAERVAAYSLTEVAPLLAYIGETLTQRVINRTSTETPPTRGSA